MQNMLGCREDLATVAGVKAVEMLRFSTQLVKSHGYDLDLEYLWNDLTSI